ncbi:ribose 5-phosphate isomerase B [candidate division NPL-UPA2 bacterium]|nr:ribose 5-phosphate isomerase B [candidate division NPL-UPA2 bacterium]
MRIALGSDHAGWEMKEDLKLYLEKIRYEVKDLGTNSPESVDYPDYALAVARAVARGEAERGIIICGTGIGSSIVANKVPGIRAALCHNDYTAEMSRSHNDANVLCLGERVIDKKSAREIVKVWLATSFSCARHTRRVEKIKKIEGVFQAKGE